jgi:glycosyltransferase involved in cell wall biosynthesis
MSGQRASEPLRIVGLATHNNHGGAQLALTKLMNALAARGHRTEVWFLYRTCGDHGIEAPEARLLWPRPARGASGYLQAALSLHRRLRKERPDALVSFLPLANVLGQMLAMFAGVPARVASQRSPGWTYAGSMQMLDRIAGTIGIYGRTVCVSRAVRSSFCYYPAAYRDRLIVVSNGIAPRSMCAEKPAARRALGIPMRAFVIAAIGRLCGEKNLKLIFDALVHTPGVLLVLAGDGEDRAALERYAQTIGVHSRVVFLGQITTARASELLTAADLFAQPSLFEGQSNAMLEAMAASLPVLATDIPSQRETLIDEEGRQCGLILPLHEPKTWADALQRLQTDPKERRRLGRAAAERSAAFTVERMAEGFEAAILAAGVRHADHSPELSGAKSPRKGGI